MLSGRNLKIMNEKIKDREIRNRISLEFDKNLFIEAERDPEKQVWCTRVTGLIGKGSVKIENIAAVTFTRKAAAELKEKSSNLALNTA